MLSLSPLGHPVVIDSDGRIAVLALRKDVTEADLERATLLYAVMRRGLLVLA